MSQIIISTQDAPQAIGPYVQGRKIGPFLYTSGQIPLDPKTGALIGDDITTQTKQALENLLAIVRAGGGNLTSFVKNTIFLKNMDHFGIVNQIYGEFFADHYPARSCVEVARLPKDVLIEIEAVCYIGE